jgi:anti-anti-sigma regulatory factor
MGELAITCRPQSAPDEPIEICVAGPITRTTTPALRDHLRRHIATAQSPSPTPSSGSRFRLNLSNCTSINVDGMLALSVAQNAARSRGADLHLVDVPLPIARQLRQHNFDDLLLEPTPDQHRDRTAPFSAGTGG